MSGFASYDSILAAISAGNSQEVPFGKLWPITSAAGVIYSSWLFAGLTSAGVLAGAGGTTAATLVTCNSNTTGAIPLVSPSSASATNPYIVSAGAMPTLSLAGTMMLIDRIADSGTLTTASGATCTLTMPGGGWARYPSGIGVQAFMEGQAAAPTATAVVAMSYTNTTPTAGRIPSPATLTAVAYKVFGSGANAPTGSPFFLLQGNDQGIKSIENISLTVAAAANVALVVCKPLLMLPCTTAMFYTERDCVIQTPKLPKLPVTTDATACLQWLFFPNAAVATPTVMGSVTFVTG
jgi:hypothetical protein